MNQNQELEIAQEFANRLEQTARDEADLLALSMVERGVQPLTIAFTGVMLAARVLTTLTKNPDEVAATLACLASVMRLRAEQLLETADPPMKH